MTIDWAFVTTSGKSYMSAAFDFSLFGYSIQLSKSSRWSWAAVGRCAKGRLFFNCVGTDQPHIYQWEVWQWDSYIHEVFVRWYTCRLWRCWAWWWLLFIWKDCTVTEQKSMLLALPSFAYKEMRWAGHVEMKIFHLSCFQASFCAFCSHHRIWGNKQVKRKKTRSFYTLRVHDSSGSLIVHDLCEGNLYEPYMVYTLIGQSHCSVVKEIWYHIYYMGCGSLSFNLRYVSRVALCHHKK